VNKLILFEDEHLLVINKPSGINTHKPDRCAPDGIHEWLTRRQPRWAKLSILQRLDKDTSGVMLFGKTRKANQSLSRQFESHTIEKRYLLLSSARPTRSKFYAQTPGAETEFEFIQAHGKFFLTAARPTTGKTHQIRQHAAENGFPILGDTEYEGQPAPRLMLHAHRLVFEHPDSGERMTMEATVPAAFDELDPLVAAREFRKLLFDEQTSAFRLVSGAADGFPEVIVDSYAGTLLVQWQSEAAARQSAALIEQLRTQCAPRAIYEQLVTRAKREQPKVVAAEQPPAGRFPIRENGLEFLISFGEGLSTGIFLDQRENRRRLLTAALAGKTVLNCFAYTCAFSVAAAKAGAITTSIDLSRKYLEWGKDNFRANGLDPAAHVFLVGDVFDWLKRFPKRGQTWDVVILDPPTFSTTKKGRAFQAERDYEELLARAMPLVVKGGTLLASTNMRTLSAENFEASLPRAAQRTGRVTESLEFETVPFDFRLAEGERPYLKTLWARLG
jgi:23S rRNA (cytosine1962-C5)-methyltransferase